MEYTKKPLRIVDQVGKLKRLGLIIDDENSAATYLSNISYYRLRAYTYPFQNNQDGEEHLFTRRGIHFKDIIDLYCFDRRLRSLVFNALEKIEVAVRSKIVNEYAVETDESHWYLDAALYSSQDKYDAIITEIEKETKRSPEDFIVHYRTKYNQPIMTPSWMTVEVLSFGTLSKLYSALTLNSETNKRIAISLGITKPKILENWFHSFSILRNYCAHHSRLWNRRFQVDIELPYNTTRPFIDRDTIRTIRSNKLFAYLCVVKYVLDIISPGNNFKKNLFDIMSDGGALFKEKDMGFPERWRFFGVWKD